MFFDIRCIGFTSWRSKFLGFIKSTLASHICSTDLIPWVHHSREEGSLHYDGGLVCLQVHLKFNTIIHCQQPSTSPINPHSCLCVIFHPSKHQSYRPSLNPIQGRRLRSASSSPFLHQRGHQENHVEVRRILVLLSCTPKPTLVRTSSLELPRRRRPPHRAVCRRCHPSVLVLKITLSSHKLHPSPNCVATRAPYLEIELARRIYPCAAARRRVLRHLSYRKRRQPSIPRSAAQIASGLSQTSRVPVNPSCAATFS
jgi:hypothetical protein